MTHVFIDTNIFVRIATQGRPGCERQHFDDLRTLVDESAFTLLVPEVVSLEVEKAFRSLPKDLESSCDKLNEEVKKATQGSWNEIDSLKEEILNRIKQFKRERIAECSKISKDIADFLQSGSVTLIPLSSNILVGAKRRQIIGKLPNCKKSSDQDALIVESLVSFFRGLTGSTASFLFCTENTKDFALEMKSNKLERRFVLDPLIQDELPHSQFSTDLASMLAVAKGFEELPEPTNAEIEEAVRLRDLHNDIDDEMFGEAHHLLTSAIHREATRQFEEDFLPSVPDDIQALRVRLTQDVHGILAECRRCRSWSERSEGKLSQWVEFVDESMIPHVSLPKLFRIKKSLEDYLKVHQQMDCDGIVADKE